MDAKLIDEEVFLDSRAYVIHEVLDPLKVDQEFMHTNGVR